MLTCYGSKAKTPIPLSADATELPRDVHWIDALQPTTEEVALLERCMGVELPDKDDLLEVEASSRMSVIDGAVTLSMPATVRDPGGFPSFTPIGFVVTEKVVATIRFAHLLSFEGLAERIVRDDDRLTGGPEATVCILEIIVDHLADVLEKSAGNLDDVSRRAFERAKGYGRGAATKRSNQVFGEMLFAIGREADLVSKVSESLLVLTRITPFLSAKALPAIAPELRARLDTVVADARSLREYQDHLSNKTAFLLDALLGLSNIDQNNVFRVLTIVSVVTIPPTFFAGLYGMNFKNMPELNWEWGYAFGLAVIALSAIIPAVWFKVKGWW